MAGSIVLVTGVTRFLGSSLAGRLSALPQIERVIGVDAALPDAQARERMGTAEFVRADIRSPLISRVIDRAEVDTVVHASATATPPSSAARTLTKEMNVIGTMQLLAACQRARQVRHLVVRSTAAVYGGSSRDPAVFAEGDEPRSVPSSGPARDAVDIEGYLRGFARRRPDVRVAVPRFSEIIGPTVRTPLTRYFSLSPFVPVLLGRDARMQLVHEQDAVEVMLRLALGDAAGTVNVAGAGTLTLRQAIRRAGRIPMPMLPGTIGLLGRALRTARIGGFSPEQVALLAHGRVLDTTRLRDDVGIALRYSTEQAFADFVGSLAPAVLPAAVRAVESGLLSAVGARRPVGTDGADAAAAQSPTGPSRPRLVSIHGEKIR
ncbi:NAD-dependent epimerase/dehydratase family protein [Nakamurella lactea]|uniref:NAD-dependent epimerase/dehydratase family protein n=1 Tax=Nakamurella lactea TaxID=459515 RepID=UPI0003F4CEE3|nr:NAD-dependent epimerase/dehydratase family protein [Nakamurella lactea]